MLSVSYWERETDMSEDISDRDLVSMEIVRLALFLENNQLVQGNASVSKLEQMIKNLLSQRDQSVKLESSSLWEALRACMRCRQAILSGETEKASGETKKMSTCMKGGQ